MLRVVHFTDTWPTTEDFLIWDSWARPYDISSGSGFSVTINAN